MPPDLSNLPSSGVLVNTTSIRWSLNPTSRFVLSSTANSPDQVLEKDNTTETLVRILRQQQPAADPAATKARQGKGNGAAAGSKRALDPAAAEQAGGKKKLAVAASLLASASASTKGPGHSSKQTYSQEDLKTKTIKELQDLLKARGMPVSGKKELLVQRMIDFQRRQKVAALGTS